MKNILRAIKWSINGKAFRGLITNRFIQFLVKLITLKVSFSQSIYNVNDKVYMARSPQKAAGYWADKYWPDDGTEVKVIYGDGIEPEVSWTYVVRYGGHNTYIVELKE